MKILALDTATENCSAALLISGALLCREELIGRGHAQRILPVIVELLSEADAALQDLTAIAFGRGPGAFTGVRLAACVAQGLAFGAALPVVAVSDLQALAQRALAQDSDVDRVLVCTDARMHEVYCGAFERGAGGLARGVRGRVRCRAARGAVAGCVAAGSRGIPGKGAGGGQRICGLP